MIKKNSLILFLAAFSMLFFKNSSYSCGKKSAKTEKLCCKKEPASKTEKKDCCSGKHPKDKDNNGCGGVVE